MTLTGVARWLVVALTAMLVACGGGSDDPGPATVFFKVDTATCRGTGATFELFVGGGKVGTEFLTVGATSRGYTSEQSTTVLSARLIDGSRTWSPETFNTPRGSTFTLLLTCI